MKAVLKNLSAALAFSAFCAVVGLLFGCPFRRLTGLPCPGCGMTRGCLALLRGNFSAAFFFHPLCFLVPVVFAAYVLKDTPPAKKLFTHQLPIMGLCVLCIAVYAVRMSLYFPDIAPMNFEENSVIGKIVPYLLLH